MLRNAWIGAMLLAACSGGDKVKLGHPDRTDVEEPPGKADVVSFEGECLEEFDGLAAEGGEVLLESDGFVEIPFDWEDVSRVITDEATWQTFQDDVGLELGEVDFGTRQVVAVWARVSSTCGMFLEDWFATQLDDDQVYVQATVIDTTGTCEEVCDAEGTAMLVITLPAEVSPIVCRVLVESCG